MIKYNGSLSSTNDLFCHDYKINKYLDLISQVLFVLFVLFGVNDAFFSCQFPHRTLPLATTLPTGGYVASQANQ